MQSILFFAVALKCVFPAGTADDPSVVAPLDLKGAPVAFWWDEHAFHAGGETFAWKDIGAAPKDGAKFKLTLGGKDGAEQTVLDGSIKLSAPKFRLGSFGRIGNADVSNVLEVVAGRDGRLRANFSASGMTPDYIQQIPSVSLKAGQRGRMEFVGKGSSSGYGGFTFYDVDDEPLYRQGFEYHDPALTFDFKYVWTEPEKMLMHLRSAGWPKKGEKYTIRLSMKDLLSDTLGSWSKSVAASAEWGEREYDFDVSDLPPGFYRAHIDYLDGSGTVIHSDRTPYMKPAAKMPWDDTTLGAEDTVPPPWTPPVFDADKFACWNRTVRFGGDGMISSMLVGGREFLAAPVELLADGQSLSFTSGLESKKVSEATYLLKSSRDGIVAHVKCEFDGYMLFDVEFPASVTSLAWRVSADRSRLTGFDDCSSDFGKIIFHAGENVVREFHPGEKPMWWMVGSAGLQGGLSDLHGWHARKLAAAGRMEADAKTVSVTTTCVDERIPPGPSRRVRFYLQPTPMKPKDATFATVPQEKIRTWTGYLCQYYETKYPGFEDPILFKRYRDEIKSGSRVFFYNGTSGVSVESPFWGWYRRDWNKNGIDYFAHEVQLLTPEKRQRNNWAYGCPNEKSFFEQKLWGINWYLHEPAPEMKDLYLDLANPHKCRNAVHGCRWKDDFGREMLDWDIYSVRELHKRVYRILKAKNPDGQMYGHMGYRRSPADAFFCMMTCGESLDLEFFRHGYTYYDVFTPEVMQMLFMPRAAEMTVKGDTQFYRARHRFAPHLLPKFNPLDPETDRAIRHSAAYFKIHDVMLEHGRYDRDGPQFYKVETSIRPLRGPGGTYSAYCLDGEPAVSVSKPHPRFIWAWFADGGKGVLVLLNDTDGEVEETVTVKGLSAKGREILDKTAYDFSTGSCRIGFGPRGAKFIAFERTKQ